MNKLALSLLIASLFLEAGCSRRTEQTAVVTASPTPIRTEEQKKQEAAGQRIRSRPKTEAASSAATTDASPSPTP